MMEYILDMNKWRSGGAQGHPNVLGLGKTYMLNEEGYMCCLGQFAKQQGVPDKYLLEIFTPNNVRNILKSSKNKSNYDKTFISEDDNSELTRRLVKINDDCNTTPKEKIKSIRKELKKEGHTLKVIPLKSETIDENTFTKKELLKIKSKLETETYDPFLCHVCYELNIDNRKEKIVTLSRWGFKEKYLKEPMEITKYSRSLEGQKTGSTCLKFTGKLKIPKNCNDEFRLARLFLITKYLESVY